MVYNGQRQKLTEVILGSAGWQAIEALAEQEGIDDFRLWYS